MIPLKDVGNKVMHTTLQQLPVGWRYSSEAVVFGGAVRDLVIGEQPKDYDICTDSATAARLKRQMLKVERHDRRESSNVGVSCRGQAAPGLGHIDAWAVEDHPMPTSLDWLHATTMFTVNGATVSLRTGRCRRVPHWYGDLQRRYLRFGPRWAEAIECYSLVHGNLHKVIERFERFMDWANAVDPEVERIYKRLKG